jgi:hypothetical protein
MMSDPKPAPEEEEQEHEGEGEGKDEGGDPAPEQAAQFKRTDREMRPAKVRERYKTR